MKSLAIGLSILLLLICVLATVLLPGTSGPFSVVNGPATAFRATRAVRAIYVGIVLAGLGTVCLSFGVAHVWFPQDGSHEAPASPDSYFNATLRC